MSQIKDLPMYQRRIIHALIFPAIFLIIIYFVRIIDFITPGSFASYGIYPWRIKNLTGILFAPLIHGGWGHLFSNTAPIFILSVLLFYFYNKIAYKVFFSIYILSGLGLWLASRGAFHIGASGLIYGLATFLAFSGILRKHIGLIAISFLVIFLYGGLVWGIFPSIYARYVSWEGHLWGALSGIAVAYLFKNQGPQRKVLDIETDDSEDDNNPYWLDNKN